MYNVVNTLAPSVLIRSSSFLQVTRAIIKSQISSKFSQNRSWTVELAAPERLKKSPQTYNGRNGLATLAASFLIRTSSFLQETMTCLKAWMSLNVNQIRPLTTELPALERLKNICTLKQSYKRTFSFSFF